MASKRLDGRYWSPDRRELRARLEALAVLYPSSLGQANKVDLAKYFNAKRNATYDAS